MPSKMEKEILTALGSTFSETEGESPDRRRVRLLKEASRLKDKEFRKLSEETQTFVNDCAESIMSKKACPKFPDDTSDEKETKSEKKEAPKGEAKETKSNKDTKEEKEPKKEAKSDKGEKPKADTKGDKDAGEKKPRKRGGALYEYRKASLLHMSWDHPKLLEHIKAKGLEMSDSTAAVARADTAAFVELINELGFERKAKD